MGTSFSNFQDRTGAHLPVIENLASHDMASYAPAILVSLEAQPIVSQHLSVKVVRLKGRMMHVAFWPFEEEEGVMVHKLTPSRETVEYNDILSIGSMSKLGAKNKIKRIERGRWICLHHWGRS